MNGGEIRSAKPPREPKVATAGQFLAWRRGLGAGVVPSIVAGHFDILQPGNCFALRRAAQRSPHVGVLVVGDGAAGGMAPQPRHGAEARMELLGGLRLASRVTVAPAEDIAAWFRLLAPCVLVVAGEQRASDPYAAAAAKAGAEILEIESVPGCFTRQIHAAMAGGRTPVALPAGLYPVASDEAAVIRGAAPGRRLVTVNGCFDILHIGHLRFLEQARAMGTDLVVLMNDDASVSAYKGPTRPVFPLGFRAAALRLFEAVTGVAPFAGDNPLATMGRLRPEIHVKGGSFEPDRVRQERDLVEGWGGRLVGTPMVEGYSTTNYIRGVGA